MNIIKLQVKDFEIIPLEKQYVVENQVNEFAIEFEFDNSWNYETKYVIFDNEETTYKRPIINNQVIIPSELLNGRTTIQIYGQNVEDGEIVKRKPSYKYSFSILNSLSTEGQEESDLPKPTQWEIYISQIETMLDEFTTDYNEFKDNITEQFNDLKEDCETKCDDVIERLEKDEQDIQTNTDNIRTNAENIDKLNTDLLDYSLITETGNKISMSINPQTYVITLSLKDKNDNTLSTQSVDLPLETMIVSASYSNGVLTFTLKNGQTLEVPIGDLISGLVSTDTFNQAVQGLSNRITTIENDYLKSTDKTELQNQITQNAHDIDDIQEEQLTQNADIESLQQENERLSRIVSGLPTKNGSGTNFLLTDMVKANIKEYELKGDTSQDGTPTPSDPIPVEVVTGNQEIKVFDKNLAVIYENIRSVGGLTSTLNSDGTITTTGLPDANYVKITGQYSINDMLINGETYTLSQSAASQLIYLQLNRYDKLNGITYYTYLSSNASETFVADTDTYTYSIVVQSGQLTDWNNTSRTITSYYQLEKGASATTFEKYKLKTKSISLGNIELNKIGNYQDRIYKSNGKWYLHKEVEKYIITENTPIESSVVSTGFNTMRVLMTNILSNNKAINSSANIKCNRFAGNVMWNRDEEGIYVDQNNVVYRINTSTIGGNTREDLLSWLTTNNIILYYILATATDTEITDTTLISQLNSIYDIILNTNNTIITNGNIPTIIDITGYVDIMSLITTQDSRSVEETRKGGDNSIEPIEEPIETKEEER